jgi:hypothetical protein
MPLLMPAIDDRRYQDLRDEALARIPVHNPEWTNFNRSDPGVTLVEIFAFLTESLLYRSNQIPERNRVKFLQLLGIALAPAASARGLITFTNERGPLSVVTLNDNLEVRAGSVPFRTERGLDVLPIEGRVYYKRAVVNPSTEQLDYYTQLYASYTGSPAVSADGTQTQKVLPLLYETVPLAATEQNGVDLSKDTVDNSLWVALLVRESDKQQGDNPFAEAVRKARKEIAGKTLSLGIVPATDEPKRNLTAVGGGESASGGASLQYQLPKGGALPSDPNARVAQYQPLDASTDVDVLAEPGVVQINLPGDTTALELWNNIDPLEAGVDRFPPALEDTKLGERVITWLRVNASSAARARLLWAGINCTTVTQRARVSGELLSPGTGEPDQSVFLSKVPVIAGSVRLIVEGFDEPWQEIEDLMSAGPEVYVPDLRLPPGERTAENKLINVFMLNRESGEIRFGDGTRGRRPPFGAAIRASYDYGVGRDGNVGPGSISTSPALPVGLKVSNPVRTWGGAQAETVSEGEKQITRYMQHRDRLVTASDFEAITLRTPGVEIGRVEVLPAFNPALAPNVPGDAPGAVTIMLIPRYDAQNPEAPMPDRFFMDAVCSHLEPRRLVTTEVFLRPPVYKGIWVSVGLEVVPGASVAQVREAVKKELLQFLSPLPPVERRGVLEDQTVLLTTPQYAEMRKGWPLGKAVAPLELLAVASRVRGVLLVNKVLVSDRSTPAQPQVTTTKTADVTSVAPVEDLPVKMSGLELPRVAGISVVVGEPISLDELRGESAAKPVIAGGTGGAGGADVPALLPIPIVPDEC